jgi:hypothetical protein
MNHISSAVAQIHAGAASSFRNLTVFPLLGEGPSDPDYVTLDEALQAKQALITEVSEGGSVPELRFENLGDRAVLLVDGEEIIGARQNRILNLTILVAAHTRIVIPVSCVERGRWSYRSREFRSGNRKLYARARAAKMAQVSYSLHRSGSRRSDQSALWNGISEKFARLSKASATEAMADLYQAEHEQLGAYEAAFKAAQGQLGAVFAINGKVAGLELFDSGATFRKLMRKLVSSYAMDAIDVPMERAQEPSLEDVRALLEQVQRSSVETFAAVGEGRDLRLSGAMIHGAALESRDRIVHLSAFPVGVLDTMATHE